MRADTAILPGSHPAQHRKHRKATEPGIELVGQLEQGRLFIDAPSQCHFDLLPVADVDQHVHCPDEFSALVPQRSGEGKKGDTSAIGSLGYCFSSSDSPFFLQRYRHRALVVWQRCPVRKIELPGAAEFLLPKARTYAPKLGGGVVIEGDATFCVGDIYGDW
jgi:hypothetical protein